MSDLPGRVSPRELPREDTGKFELPILANTPTKSPNELEDEAGAETTAEGDASIRPGYMRRCLDFRGQVFFQTEDTGAQRTEKDFDCAVST